MNEIYQIKCIIFNFWTKYDIYNMYKYECGSVMAFILYLSIIRVCVQYLDVPSYGNSCLAPKFISFFFIH